MLIDDDTLIEQQLRREFGIHTTLAQRAASGMDPVSTDNNHADDEIAGIVNGLALTSVSKSPVNVLGHGKRKRQNEEAAEELPKKRGRKAAGHESEVASTSMDPAQIMPPKRGRPRKKQEDDRVEHRQTMTASEEQGSNQGVAENGIHKSPRSAQKIPGKLKRPSQKTQEARRHMVETYPDVAPQKKVRDLYDEILEPPISEAAPAKGIKKSARRIRIIPAKPDSTSAFEGHSSAILNGRATSSWPSESTYYKDGRGGGDAGHLLPSAPADKAMSTKSKPAQRSNQAKKRDGRESPQTKGFTGNVSSDQRPDIDKSVEGQDHEEEEVHAQQEDQRSYSHSSNRAGADGSDQVSERSVDEEEDSDESVDEDEDQPQFDLLGEEKEWMKILDAARSVCGKKLLCYKNPNVLTGRIKKLVAKIKKARKTYQRLLHAGVDHLQVDEVSEKLQDYLSDIEISIIDQNISERSAGTEKSEMIEDIYRYAIPGLVLLLNDAFAYHAPRGKGLREYEALTEIVRLQDMVLKLCEKAKGWKAKPLTDSPIIKPNLRVIFPYLRDMRRGTFKDELAEQRRKWKNRQNALKTARREAEELKQSQQRINTSLPRMTSRHSKILEDIERNRRKWRGSEDRLGPPVKEQNEVIQISTTLPPTQSSKSSTKWTQKETAVLWRELEEGYNENDSGRSSTTKYLRIDFKFNCGVVEERYLAILNAPLLQNRLPEHIREQALVWKPYLLEVHSARKPPVSLEWIKSIL